MSVRLPGQQTPVCSAPDCGQPPVLQWQRAATPDETTASHIQLRAKHADGRAVEVVNAQIHITELEQKQAILPATAEGAHVRRLLDDQLAQARAELATVQARPPVDPDPGPVTIAVFACDEHALDLEAAARLHDSDCGHFTGGCACGTTP